MVNAHSVNADNLINNIIECSQSLCDGVQHQNTARKDDEMPLFQVVMCIFYILSCFDENTIVHILSAPFEILSTSPTQVSKADNSL